ncbi:MAG TPA: hypothetical protein VFZ66_21940 [Herpetosiphonaceae bacterium]
MLHMLGRRESSILEGAAVSRLRGGTRATLVLGRSHITDLRVYQDDRWFLDRARVGVWGCMLL